MTLKKGLVFQIALTVFLAITSESFAQVSVAQYGDGAEAQPSLPKAKIEEKAFISLDLARKVIGFDAMPDGSHWFVVDKFGVLQSMLYDGVRSTREFNEISHANAQLSPKGDYLVWLGLDRHFTDKGFDSTVVYVYKDMNLLGEFLADYPSIQFSRTGKSWGVVMPYANVLQSGDRDFVMVNGTVVGHNNAKPHDLSFDHTEEQWAYRATEGKEERLVTSEGTELLRSHLVDPSPYKMQRDSVVYHFTPDESFRDLLISGRDFDFHFAHQALLRKTSYDPQSLDTAHSYIEFKGSNQPMFRWIMNILIDSAGKHIAYFACDPAQDNLGHNANERRAVVIHDGKIIGGPYESAGRIFLSPSGAHVLYSTGTDHGSVYLDAKAVVEISQVQDAVWSHDEKHVAYSATGEHSKVFVVLGGKRSRDYEAIGRIGWLPGGNGIEYVALLNGKLMKVKQYL